MAQKWCSDQISIRLRDIFLIWNIEMTNIKHRSDFFLQFQRWLHRPDVTPLRDHSNSPPESGDGIENAMWKAYRAGYTQALKDSEAIQMLGGFFRAK
ncbi:hypothetical protein ACFIQG_21160 [Comamonas odontotermitis]|uniref:hypothetical protein n=1 Tax=Comamonas odontotermitis TaxID=379895 RepID=UPI00366DEAAC